MPNVSCKKSKKWEVKELEMKTLHKCDPWGKNLVAYYSDGL
jgi:hypothetical protein